MSSIKTLALVMCSVYAVAARAETPKLTLDDIDQLSRAQVVHSLTGGDTKGAPAVSPAPTPVLAPAPAVPASAPAAVSTRHVPHADPVRFVGAYRDEHGASYVLYDFDGAVYPGRVGTTLLNGWTARKVDGFRVTVSEGAGKHPRTWTETIRPSTPAPVGAVSSGNAALQAINDLSSPLPPAGRNAVSPLFAQRR